MTQWSYNFASKFKFTEEETKVGEFSRQNHLPENSTHNRLQEKVVVISSWVTYKNP